MSITTASVARFLIDGVVYQARLLVMSFHVSKSGRACAHAIGRPDMPFSGAHVPAGRPKERVLPGDVGLVMADRPFSYGAAKQWLGADGACTAKVLSQVASGSKSNRRLRCNTVVGGFRDETALFLGAVFVQTDTAVDNIRLLGDLTPAVE